MTTTVRSSRIRGAARRGPRTARKQAGSPTPLQILLALNKNTKDMCFGPSVCARVLEIVEDSSGVSELLQKDFLRDSAKCRGHVFVYQPGETMEAILARTGNTMRSPDGARMPLLNLTGAEYQSHTFFLRQRAPGWHGVGINPLPHSVNLGPLEQTTMLVSYIEGLYASSAEMPPDQREAVDEFEKMCGDGSETQGSSVRPQVNQNWMLWRLSINADNRPSPVTVLWLYYVCYCLTGHRLFKDFVATNAMTPDGEVVCIGNSGAKGLEIRLVGSDQFDTSDVHVGYSCELSVSS